MSRLSEAYRDAIESGIPPAAIRAYVEEVQGMHHLSYALDSVAEAFQGAYDSFRDFAWELATDTLEIPEGMRGYFDVEAFARDLEMDYSAARGGDGALYIFRSV